MQVLLRLVVLAVLATCAAAWFVTRPAGLAADWDAGLVPDPEAGALVFAAGGCASCHSPPGAAEPTAQPVLAGGRAFPSKFGTFYAPNISSDASQGIGEWSLQEFAGAMTLGVSPEGSHYYPAFPYGSYTLMAPQDVVDLHAYMQSLPADPTPSRAHDVDFPFSLRRGIGVWKALYMPDGFATGDDLADDQVLRGRYLVEALGHCAECHTPRTSLGGLDRTRWMDGAPAPAGDGRIPGITRRHLDWSEADLLAYFTTGFTPEYDTAGGDMAEVVKNLAMLPEPDRAAIAAYVFRLP